MIGRDGPGHFGFTGRQKSVKLERLVYGKTNHGKCVRWGQQRMQKLGIVSNCWTDLIRSGASLTALIKSSVAEGLCHIELRQGSCGEFEDISSSLVLKQLEELSVNHPRVRLNYAMPLAFFGHWSDSVARVETAIQATKAIQPVTPELRIVDLTTSTAVGIAEFQGATQSLAGLADQLFEKNIRLTIEHAKQEWNLFHDVFQTARDRSDSGNLWYCLDPANLSFAGEESLNEQVTREIELENISMVHVKQYRDGMIDTKLGQGTVDWPAIISILQVRGYVGPVLFELRSSPTIQLEIESAVKKWNGWLMQGEQ